MGYTQHTIELIERHLDGVESVLDLGSQNIYAGDYDPNKPPFASEWYKAKGIDYVCIDLAGDNGAREIDLSRPFSLGIHPAFDLVVDAGTSEHIVQMADYESVSFHDGHINSIYPKGDVTEDQISKGYYNCWLNKFNLCKVGGLIISENPKVGHWPDHGYSYITDTFPELLCAISDLELIESGTNAAMGNETSGINVYSVLKKTGETFPSFEQFCELPVYRK